MLLSGSAGCSGVGGGVGVALGATRSSSSFKPSWVGAVSDAAVVVALRGLVGVGVVFGCFPARRAGAARRRRGDAAMRLARPTCAAVRHTFARQPRARGAHAARHHDRRRLDRAARRAARAAARRRCSGRASSANEADLIQVRRDEPPPQADGSKTTARALARATPTRSTSRRCSTARAVTSEQSRERARRSTQAQEEADARWSAPTPARWRSTASSSRAGRFLDADGLRASGGACAWSATRCGASCSTSAVDSSSVQRHQIDGQCGRWSACSSTSRCSAQRRRHVDVEPQGAGAADHVRRALRARRTRAARSSCASAGPGSLAARMHARVERRGRADAAAAALRGARTSRSRARRARQPGAADLAHHQDAAARHRRCSRCSSAASTS